MKSQQVFGAIGISLWYLALIISPLGYLVGKDKIKPLIFARRAIGVSSTYFVLLHAIITIWVQLGGFSGVLLLSAFYKYSLLAGGVSMMILLAMAVTSFDAVIKKMTFKRWKLLHRLGYIGGILALVHIWALGTHATYTFVQVVAFVALGVLSGLESYRLTINIGNKFPELRDKEYFAAILIGVWAVFLTGILAIPQLINNYHSKHNSHAILTEKENI